MTEQTFIERHAPEWQRLEALLAAHDKSPRGADREEIVPLYRRSCQHLALARQRLYGAALIERLNALALDGHRVVYGGARGFARRIAEFFAAGLPALVRERRRPVLAVTALFYGPLLAVFALALAEPGLAEGLIGREMAANLDRMYDPSSDQFLRQRPIDNDLVMFGFYIWNNVGIDLRVFGSGALLGIGALFSVAYNAVFFGAAAAYVVESGRSAQFFPFVSGHAAFELTGLVLSGAAGVELGFAVLAPGRRTRSEALRAAARRAIGLVYGAATLTALAAVIEAFWSARAATPSGVKYAFGALMWLTVLLYFGLAGRSRAA